MKSAAINLATQVQTGVAIIMAMYLGTLLLYPFFPEKRDNTTQDLKGGGENLEQVNCTLSVKIWQVEERDKQPNWSYTVR